jgi:hypothetical protein
MESDSAIYDYQGGAWSYIGVDEATQFKPMMLSYPKSRQRRPEGSAIPIRWRGASNPGGVGHDYIKQRYVKTSDGRDPSTPNRQFFPATLEDNPNIDREEYIAQLKESGIDPITLEQLLKGNWDAVIGGRFKPGWFANRYHKKGLVYWLGAEIVGLPQIRDRFITVDPAATVKKTAKSDPDYTVISSWWLTERGNLMWMGCRRERVEIPDIPPLIAQEYLRWGANRAYVEGFGIGQGPGQLAAKYALPDGRYRTRYKPSVIPRILSASVIARSNAVTAAAD